MTSTSYKLVEAKILYIKVKLKYIKNGLKGAVSGRLKRHNKMIINEDKILIEY